MWLCFELTGRSHMACRGTQIESIASIAYVLCNVSMVRKIKSRSLVSLEKSALSITSFTMQLGASLEQ
jgi:hypothetical protein